MAGTPTRITGEVPFYFEKSNLFRVIHVDGAFGSPSPGNHFIHMAIFSERSPIPRTIVHRVDNGILGSEMAERREAKEGIFREVEADLVMNLDAAIAVRDWLSQRIDEVQALATMLRDG